MNTEVQKVVKMTVHDIISHRGKKVLIMSINSHSLCTMLYLVNIHTNFHSPCTMLYPAKIH